MEESGEYFENHIKNVVTNGFITYGLAIGHQLRLFDVLASFDQFTDVNTIATKANCKERYIEEWLKMMTVAHILDADSTGEKFFLPVHRRAALCSTSSPVNRHLERIPILTYHHDGVLECFKNSGPYSVSPPPRLLEVVDNKTEQFWQSALEKIFKPHVKGLFNDLENGISFCDIGCARGKLTLLLARLFPNSNFVGIDMQPNYIATAKSLIGDHKNVEFALCNITALNIAEFASKFNYVHASKLIHDLDEPETAIREMFRLLKPGGRAIILELDFEDSVHENAKIPESSLYYVYSMYYCLSSSLQSAESSNLGAVPGREKLKSYFINTGFSQVNLHSIGDASRTLLIVATK